MKTYLTFYIEGFESYDEETKSYGEVKKFEVIAKTEEEAIEKCKKLLKCNNYKVWSVSEKFYANSN